MTVEFDDTADFVEEIQALDLEDFDQKVVRLSLVNDKINDGLWKVFARAGFVSIGEIYSLTEYCGNDGAGGEEESKSRACELLNAIRSAAAEKGLSVRGGVYAE